MKSNSLMSKTAAAYLILSENRKPMMIRDVCELAISRGLIKTKGKTPASTMAADLYLENIRYEQRNEKPRFVRVGHGEWGLTEWKRR